MGKVFGGGGESWTPVRQLAACRSTCLASSIKLTLPDPTRRVIQGESEKFDCSSSDTRSSGPVLYDDC